MGSRENADDDDTSVVAARQRRLQNVDRTLYPAAREGLPRDRHGHRGRDLRFGGRGPRTFGAAGAGIVQRPHGREGRRARRARTQGTGPGQADQRAARRPEQCAGAAVGASATTRLVKAINASIEQLRAERNKAQQEITRRFPSYADLIDPKPPTVEQIKATLAPGEAFLSFYFGRECQLRLGGSRRMVPSPSQPCRRLAASWRRKIRKLRESLEPQAAMISDIPAFDVALGYELYSLLLKPVERGWKSAKQPDRRDQWRIGPAAAVIAADRSRWTIAADGRSPCLRVTGTCHGWRAPTR